MRIHCNPSEYADIQGSFDIQIDELMQIILICNHDSDLILGVMASQIISVSIVYSTVDQAQIKENIKAPRHWPLWGEFTGDRRIPLTKGQ